MGVVNDLFAFVPGIITTRLRALGLIDSSGVAATNANLGKISCVTAPAGVSVDDQTHSDITWTVEVSDALNGVDVSGAPTKAFTCTEAGTYMAIVTGGMENVGGASEWGLYVSHYDSSGANQAGGTSNFGSIQAAGNSTWTTTWIGTMAAGDYLKGRIYHSSNGARNRNGMRMTITRIR